MSLSEEDARTEGDEDEAATGSATAAAADADAAAAEAAAAAAVAVVADAVDGGRGGVGGSMWLREAEADSKEALYTADAAGSSSACSTESPDIESARAGC